MKAVAGMASSQEPMLHASGWRRRSQQVDPVNGRNSAAGAATGEIIADRITLGREASGKEEQTPASDPAGAGLSPTMKNVMGLPAVLEKLSARSAERPEVKGLQNAVQHIRENLERHGYVGFPPSAGTDDQPVESPGMADESPVVANLTEDGASETGALIVAEIPDESSPAVEERIVTVTDDLSGAAENRT
ncbi:MAG: hypothetical protein AB2L22_09160 [Syntrophales bacterium]